MISSYALAEIGQSHVLNEIRTIVEMDSQRVKPAGDPRHVPTAGPRRSDAATRRKLLEDLEHDQLEGAVTDLAR